jgi:hypothetical protein
MDERDPLEVLQERVAKGIAWLTENDQSGAFHFWYKAGLTSASPMPSQTPERIEQWRRYYSNRSTWETLFSRMNRLEKERARGQEAATL